MQTATVPIITCVVFFILEFIKLLTKSNDMFKKFIPVISGFLGMGVSVMLYYVAPTSLAVENVVHAVMIGLASGLAATGTHQIFKQIMKE